MHAFQTRRLIFVVGIILKLSYCLIFLYTGIYIYINHEIENHPGLISSRQYIITIIGNININ
jgi:hypothetical protein